MNLMKLPFFTETGERPVFQHIKRNLLFRYPGGKSFYADILLNKMGKHFENADYFCDLFVGGGSVSMAAAFSDSAKKIIMNDLHPWISSFWKSLTDENLRSQALTLIHATQPDMATFLNLRNKQKEGWPKTEAEKILYGVFFNRTTFSGKLDDMPIGGWKQVNPDGTPKKWTVGCRYNPIRLEKKINALASLFYERLQVFSQDTSDLLVSKNIPKNSCVYLDPPYFEGGKKYYTKKFKTLEEHTRLRDAVKKFGRKVFLSYDDCPEIRSLYSGAKFNSIDVTYVMTKARKPKKTTELLIEVN